METSVSQSVQKKPRLEWLDALRGFTMILVVANHVLGLGLGMSPKVSSSMQFLVMFRMPLFFFVSGWQDFGYPFVEEDTCADYSNGSVLPFWCSHLR